MPVTAKLSKRFYERLGDEIANELVDWFNKVDESYRTDLRDLNERNFDRFDARLEQRLAGQGATIREEMTALGSNLRIDIARVEARLHADFVVQMRWIIGIWIVQTGAILTTLLALR